MPGAAIAMNNHTSRTILIASPPLADADHAGFVSIPRRVIEHAAAELRYAPNVLLRAPFFNALDKRDHRRRAAEAGEADLHRARTREQVLDDVLHLADAAATDDRNLHALRALVDHPKHDRFDAGTR